MTLRLSSDYVPTPPVSPTALHLLLEAAQNLSPEQQSTLFSRIDWNTPQFQTTWKTTPESTSYDRSNQASPIFPAYLVGSLADHVMANKILHEGHFNHVASLNSHELRQAFHDQQFGPMAFFEGAIDWAKPKNIFSFLQSLDAANESPVKTQKRKVSALDSTVVRHVHDLLDKESRALRRITRQWISAPLEDQVHTMLILERAICVWNHFAPRTTFSKTLAPLEKFDLAAYSIPPTDLTELSTWYSERYGTQSNTRTQYQHRATPHYFRAQVFHYALTQGNEPLMNFLWDNGVIPLRETIVAAFINGQFERVPQILDRIRKNAPIFEEVCTEFADQSFGPMQSHARREDSKVPLILESISSELKNHLRSVFYQSFSSESELYGKEQRNQWEQHRVQIGLTLERLYADACIVPTDVATPALTQPPVVEVQPQKPKKRKSSKKSSLLVDTETIEVEEAPYEEDSYEKEHTEQRRKQLLQFRYTDTQQAVDAARGRFWNQLIPYLPLIGSSGLQSLLKSQTQISFPQVSSTLLATDQLALFNSMEESYRRHLTQRLDAAKASGDSAQTSHLKKLLVDHNTSLVELLTSRFCAFDADSRRLDREGPKSRYKTPQTFIEALIRTVKTNEPLFELYKSHMKEVLNNSMRFLKKDDSIFSYFEQTIMNHALKIRKTQIAEHQKTGPKNAPSI